MEEIKKWFENKKAESKERAEKFIKLPDADSCQIPALRPDELDFVVSRKIDETLKTILIPSCLTIAVYQLRKFYPFKGLYREHRRFGFAATFIGSFYGANYFYQKELKRNDFYLRELDEDGLLRFQLGTVLLQECLQNILKSSKFRPVATPRSMN